ncbi:hypothetical protein [Nakamurella sp. PAMC28650]|uniref:hypothetical protein n=1 Tax=Nakamurella sp. PAMC28650 TaxID=2762325 RepID=UPI00164E211C|nr:hypothetical protein [Nakamurella sp. PAMC28650]QNK82899.1 hypothetical protein H7F38_09630 [Nakamurella sp. PAMC28650]
MVDQTETSGAALRFDGNGEEHHVAEATYEQARSALLDMIAAALHPADGSALGEAEIVDLIDDRVISSSSLTKVLPAARTWRAETITALKRAHLSDSPSLAQISPRRPPGVR